MKKNLLIMSVLFLICLSCSKTMDSLLSAGGNTEALIIAVDIKDIANNSVLLSSEIDTATNTVTIIPEDGIDKRNLKFFATLSDGAVSKPMNGTRMDFSSPVTFTVISESHGTTRNWTIILITKNEEAAITSIDSMTDKEGAAVLVSSEMDMESRTVTVTVKEGTDLKSLKLHASISEGATVEPAIDVPTDFSDPVEYTVTSEDGETVYTWLVTVVVKEFIDDDSGFDYNLDPAKWTLNNAKSDHFDNRDETIWTFSQTSSDNFDYDPENIFVANGKLRITVETQEERYTAGKIKSAFEINVNSYVKIRAKTVNKQAMVNSFIALQSGTASPISLMETISGGSGTFYSSLRRAEDTLIDSKATVTNTNLSNDYHVYGLERRNEYLRFFLDGKVIWEFETSKYPDLSKQLLNLIIGIGPLEDSQPNGAELPSFLLVDYVEVYDAVNTGETAPSYGDNLVKNPGFEAYEDDPHIGTDNPEGWTVTKSSGNTEVWVFKDWQGYKESLSRFHFGVPGSSTTFNYTISQKISNLPDGLYRLDVWAYMVEGYNTFDPLPRLFAKEYGGSEKEARIDNVGPEYEQSSWKKYVVNNIYVSNGSCEIGVQAPGNGQARLFIDDFSFVKVDY